MSFNPESSIYHSFVSLTEKYTRLPYEFQTYSNGATDVNYIFWKDELSVNKKEELAMKAMNIVISLVIDYSFINELDDFLEENPLYTFLGSFNHRIRFSLAEELIDKENLYTLGIKLATDSDNIEEVKVGILILGHFENDLSRKIIKTLGLHSDFTIYAIEASENFVRSNKFVFELAQNTMGYGKLVAVTRMRPVSIEQQNWLFFYGANNEALPNMAAIICLEKVDMTYYYQNLTLNDEIYPTLSYMIAYACEHSNFLKFRMGILLENFIKASKVYSKYFYDLIAIIHMERSISECLSDRNKDIVYNILPVEKLKNLKTICKEILGQRRWNYVILRQLQSPEASTGLILQAIKRFPVDIQFHHFLPILSREPFNMKVLQYTLMDNPSVFVKDAKEFIHYYAPTEVFEENPQNIGEEEITVDYIPDIWLVYLLKAYRINKEYDEELLGKSLFSRFPDVRKEAIGLLNMFKSRWSDKVEPLLLKACEVEPNESIKNRIKRVLGILVDKKSKNQKYVEMENQRAIPTYNDIELGYSIIVGTFYHDLTVLEETVTYGMILYLVREKDNEYDENAIMVVSKDGYVIGYIPKSDNKAYVRLMEDGEKLYAILKSDSLENKPKIQIMHNKSGEPGTVIDFPGK